MTRILLRLLPLLAITLLASCSTYNTRFASASKAPVKAGQFAGAYSGQWTSTSHPGGGGNLRCILTKMNASDYNADFHATWHGFASEHTVVLHTKPAARKKSDSGVRDFEGTSKLRTPIGAGTYTCKGTMDSRTLRACYDATYDRGTFEIARTGPKNNGR
ncbi:MAG: hypothetical protein ABI318_21805 [Chthoniobacteraceae bacterium]